MAFGISLHVFNDAVGDSRLLNDISGKCISVDGLVNDRRSSQ